MVDMEAERRDHHCGFCGLMVYGDALEHPCCARAKAAGLDECAGCEQFRRGRGKRG